MTVSDTEFFTWECLQQGHCNGCEVASFVKREGVPIETQKKMIGVATAAGMRLHDGELPEHIIEDLAQTQTGLSRSAVEVTVRGYQQWVDNDCRSVIDQQEVTTGE